MSRRMSRDVRKLRASAAYQGKSPFEGVVIRVARPVKIEPSAEDATLAIIRAARLDYRPDEVPALRYSRIVRDSNRALTESSSLRWLGNDSLSTQTVENLPNLSRKLGIRVSNLYAAQLGQLALRRPPEARNNSAAVVAYLKFRSEEDEAVIRAERDETLKACGEEPKDGPLYARLGRILSISGEGLELLEQSLAEIDPNSPVGIEPVGIIQARLKSR